LTGALWWLEHHVLEGAVVHAVTLVCEACTGIRREHMPQVPAAFCTGDLDAVIRLRLQRAVYRISTALIER